MEHFVVTEISRHGYLAVFFLMVLESACIPIPSEAVLLFGGALAGGLVLSGVPSHLDAWGVALAGTGGNVVGAWIAYGVGRAGGRPLVERWGRYVLLRRRELDRAERFFARRGRPAVFFGRVLPVVRTFISLPAGVAEMPFAAFSVLTFLGSLPWAFALSYAGFAVASNWRSVSAGFRPATLVIAGLVGTAVVWWIVRRVRQRHEVAPRL